MRLCCVGSAAVVGVVAQNVGAVRTCAGRAPAMMSVGMETGTAGRATMGPSRAAGSPVLRDVLLLGGTSNPAVRYQLHRCLRNQPSQGGNVARGAPRRRRRRGCVAVDATPGEVHDVGGARNVVRGQPTGRWPLWHFGTGFTESARTPYFRDVAIIQKPSFEVSVDGGGRWSVVHGDRMEVGVGEDNDGGGACGEDGGFPVRVVVDAIEALRLRGGGRDDGRGARRGARGGVEGAAAWR